MRIVVAIVFFVTVQSCILPPPSVLQLILEYAKWRSWEEIVLFTNRSTTNCAVSFAKPLIECLAEEGISLSVQSAMIPNVKDVLHIKRHRIGSVVLLDGLNYTSAENVLNIASHKLLFNYYISWLLITTQNNDASIDTVLRDLNISIDSDVIVATASMSLPATTNLLRKYWNRTCPSIHHYGISYDFKEIPMRKVEENATINLTFSPVENKTAFFHFVHVYKIRNSDNTSLVTQSLGTWSPGSWSIQMPVSVKLRDDLKGYPIIFGVLNGTNDGQTDVIDEVEANDIAPLLDFASFVTGSINASIELVLHEKLGMLNNKVWSHLLGDVVSGTVDVGLGYITINDERLADMTFSHPLIRYMRNVYYHPLETGIMRDIFRQPFNNYLLGCVALTYGVILIAMGLIIYAAKTSFNHEEEKNVGIGEAALWCISIMCMQGSPWTPRSPSGKTLLLFSLMFALVTYNAYAGFITSILSVQASGIKSITDLLSHNFKLGYSVTDDEYIRNVNDTHLRQLYIKAFNNRESRLDTVAGLVKAVDGHYGFFVSATLARRVLKTTLVQERCTLRELPLPQTFTVVALPMANSCPYKKIINLNILKIRERGVLNRITERMLPEMPRCKAPTTFHSARLADVYSAFFIFMAGVVTAVSIGIFERIWNKRRQMHATIMRGMRQHHLMPHFPHLPHLPHFSNFPQLPHIPYLSHFPNFHLNNANSQHYPQENQEQVYEGPGINQADQMVQEDGNVQLNPNSNMVQLEEAIPMPEVYLNKETQEIPRESIKGSRGKSRFSSWRKHSSNKKSTWTSFSGLSKKKSKMTDRNTPATHPDTSISPANVFPFNN